MSEPIDRNCVPALLKSMPCAVIDDAVRIDAAFASVVLETLKEAVPAPVSVIAPVTFSRPPFAIVSVRLFTAFASATEFALAVTPLPMVIVLLFVRNTSLEEVGIAPLDHEAGLLHVPTPVDHVTLWAEARGAHIAPNAKIPAAKHRRFITLSLDFYPARHAIAEQRAETAANAGENKRTRLPTLPSADAYPAVG